MTRRTLSLLLPLALAACTLALPGGGDKAPEASPLGAETIETTTLAAPGGAAPETGEAGPAAEPAAATAPAPETEPPPEPPAAEPAPDTPVAAAAEGAGAVPAPLSPEARACAKRGGNYVQSPSGGNVCVRPTRDGGKACTRQSQCESLCLARSGSCAPITPVFGCNDILQDDGRRMTLCLD